MNSRITELTNSIEELRKIKELAKQLETIKLTPAWKAVMDQSVMVDLVVDTTMELAGASQAQKEHNLAILTGISVIKAHLDLIPLQAETADIQIKEAEEAITALQQQG